MTWGHPGGAVLSSYRRGREGFPGGGAAPAAGAGPGGLGRDGLSTPPSLGRPARRPARAAEGLPAPPRRAAALCVAVPVPLKQPESGLRRLLSDSVSEPWGAGLPHGAVLICPPFISVRRADFHCKKQEETRDMSCLSCSVTTSASPPWCSRPWSTAAVGTQRRRLARCTRRRI